MPPALSTIVSEENRALWGWLIAILLSAILIPAGGLGLAASAGLFALIALPVQTIGRHLRKPAVVTILAALTLGWITLSHVWSPYRNPDEVLKLAILTPLFILVPIAAARISASGQTLARTGFIAGVAFVLFTLLMESLTGGDMTLGYKLAVEGYDAGRTDLQIRVDKVLSRGATPAIMLGGIAVILLWSQRLLPLRLMAGLAATILVVIALDFSAQANAVALLAATAAAALTWKWPVTTLRVLLTGLGVMIVAGPLLFAALLAITGPELSSALPMSWEWRLEIWSFALEQIRAAPLAGHGIGAARELHAVGELRGHQIDLLPLHAHNASLTIWLETGLIGAGLCAAALFALARAIPASGALARRTAMMIVFALVVWAVNVTFSYGVWQEWHHGALALAIAAALIARPRT